MEQWLEFAGNHPFLTGGFVVVLILLIYAEIQRRFQGFEELSGALAVQRINRSDAVVMDVSALADYNKGHIVEAMHVPVSQLQASNTQIENLKDRPILVVCKNGQSAPQAAAKLIKLGFGNVATLKGGMAQWRTDNYPVSK